MGGKNNKLLIGDPAEGVKSINIEDLNNIWVTKYCLVLNPIEKLIKAKEENKNKRSWFIKLLQKDSNILISSILIGVILSILSMATTVITQKLIDNILPSKNITTLLLTIAFLFFLLVVKSTLTYLRSIFLIKQNRNFNNRIIDYFYSTLLNLPKRFFDTRAIGDIVARLNDSSRIQKFISQLAGNIIIDAIMFTISLIFLFYYSKFFGITSFIFFTIYFILTRLQTKTVVDKQQKIMRTYAEVETYYINTISGISEIKNFNKQSAFNHHNKAIYQKHQANIYNLGKLQTKLNLINGLLSSIFLVFIFGIGAFKIINDELKLGVFMAIFGIRSSLLPFVTNLAMLVIPLNEAKIAFNRMFEFTGLESEKNTGTENFSFNEIYIKNISFRHTGHKQLFRNISFNVKKGEIIAIIGENGCGKSTLTQILSKFYNYEDGIITINKDIQLENINIEKWRQTIAIVPQSIHIFNGTVIENIAMDFDHNDFNPILEYLYTSGLIQFFNDFPSGLMTIIGEIGINLSGGQKQLIAIARALVKQPNLLILDEATSAMDTYTESFIIQLLQRISNNTAIIFITHRLHILKNFTDRIYIIEDGEINHFGNHSKLITSNNFYSNFWSTIDKQ